MSESPDKPTGLDPDRTIELVVQKADDLFLVWASSKESIIANDDELVHVIRDCLDDTAVPTVPAGMPAAGSFMRSAMQLADAFLPPSQASDEEPVAVHVAISRKGSRFIVWPPRGAPKPCKSLADVAAKVAEVCADKNMPRVPAGGPPDPGVELAKRIAGGASSYGRLMSEAAE